MHIESQMRQVLVQVSLAADKITMNKTTIDRLTITDNPIDYNSSAALSGGVQVGLDIIEKCIQVDKKRFIFIYNLYYSYAMASRAQHALSKHRRFSNAFNDKLTLLSL